MDIKIEPEDETSSTNSTDNTYNTCHETSYNNLVKRERFKDDLNLGNNELSSFDNDNYKQHSNIKSEDDTLWENCKNDVSGENHITKKEPLDFGESSFNQNEKNQLLTIKIEASATPPRPSSILSMTPPVSIDNRVIPKQQKVVVITLEKVIFYENNFVCKVCFSIFDSIDSLKLHNKYHNKDTFEIKCGKEIEEIPIEFGECYERVGGINFKDCKPTADVSGIVFPAVEKPFKCKECEYATVFSFSLKSHMMRHSGEKPFKCDICNYRTAKSSDLKRHSLRHTKEKPFKCDRCEFKTSYSSNLKTHKILHCGEKSVKNDVNSLKMKKGVVFDWGEKPFGCDRCEFKSVRSNDLKRHKMYHTGEKPFNCDICDYKTAYFTHLKVHKMSHNGEKPWKCDVCDYTCTHASNLKTHKMMHSGEKPFKCDQCEFKCVRSTDLKRHKMSHSGEKPFRCDVCDYKTAYCTDLKKHKLIHDKNYQV